MKLVAIKIARDCRMVTIPKIVMDQIGVSDSDLVAFVQDDDGRIVIRKGAPEGVTA